MNIKSFKNLLRNLVTLRLLSPIISEHLFLIFGCQRSGTTLLLAILNSHPQITGVDESEFPSSYPFPSAQRLFLNKLLNHYSCFKMLQHSHKVKFLRRYYPKSKILWPIRNPYSTILSMKKLVNSQGNWIERCVLNKIKRLIPFYKELESIDFSYLSNTELAAIYWVYINRFPSILINNEFDVFIFKYENLLKNPRQQLQQIMQFLELPWSEQLLKFHEVNESKILAGGTRTDRPINSTRSNDFKELSREEIPKINSICQPLMIDYGYARVSPEILE